MTTNTENKRNINELLALKTYQGMSDEEIDEVINYKVRVEVLRRISEGEKQNITNAFEASIAMCAESVQRVDTMLQSIYGIKPELRSVEVCNE